MLEKNYFIFNNMSDTPDYDDGYDTFPDQSDAESNADGDWVGDVDFTSDEEPEPAPPPPPPPPQFGRSGFGNVRGFAGFREEWEKKQAEEQRKKDEEKALWKSGPKNVAKEFKKRVFDIALTRQQLNTSQESREYYQVFEQLPIDSSGGKIIEHLYLESFPHLKIFYEYIDFLISTRDYVDIPTAPYQDLVEDMNDKFQFKVATNTSCFTDTIDYGGITKIFFEQLSLEFSRIILDQPDEHKYDKAKTLSHNGLTLLERLKLMMTLAIANESPQAFTIDDITLNRCFNTKNIKYFDIISACGMVTGPLLYTNEGKFDEIKNLQIICNYLNENTNVCTDDNIREHYSLDKVDFSESGFMTKYMLGHNYCPLIVTGGSDDVEAKKQIDAILTSNLTKSGKVKAIMKLSGVSNEIKQIGLAAARNNNTCCENKTCVLISEKDKEEFEDTFAEFVGDILDIYQQNEGYIPSDSMSEEVFLNLLPFFKTVKANSAKGIKHILSVIKWRPPILHFTADKWPTYDEDSKKTVEYMRRYIGELSTVENKKAVTVEDEEKAVTVTVTVEDFLSFTTGSSSLPAHMRFGFRTDGPSNSAGTLHLPNSHTCFNSIEVPYLTGSDDYYAAYKRKFDDSILAVNQKPTGGGYKIQGKKKKKKTRRTKNKTRK